MRAYWFSRDDGTTIHLTTPAEVGQIDTFDGTPIPCSRGLHGSPTPWDALSYARGPILWIVELGGEVVPHGNPVDKHVAQSREYLFRVDLTKQLRVFAAQCALDVFDKWDPPDVVREYIEGTARGEDKSLISAAACAATWEAARDARDAAKAATCSAIWDATRAARDAASAATWADARDATWEAARAAWEAAKAATWAVARDATWEAASAAREAAKAATCAAACAATRDATRDAWEAARAEQREHFNRFVFGVLEEAGWEVS